MERSATAGGLPDLPAHGACATVPLCGLVRFESRRVNRSGAEHRGRAAAPGQTSILNTVSITVPSTHLIAAMGSSVRRG
ncbi:MAG: hypothetical protein KAI97_09810, partial [Gemmatimonadetes bacterium]|nr:hypothetical protein [Gemmatimonadota bacterium]